MPEPSHLTSHPTKHQMIKLAMKFYVLYMLTFLVTTNAQPDMSGRIG